ncbi:hypothetical protein SAMN05216360_10516 [Methylobacterium phyllostachyos]|uniref:Uncharacterized protein n=1 Tax=Methylobacterium phyllostachyos TaxID=582672 RepID=A0A1G9XSF6_9HYPH|nr:hypothetical protein [Methylobacterium phyllostachyos]SDM99747.1 hypothetical protein SAMN05216360_10516 [Methylobacterium phyllostachyos]
MIVSNRPSRAVKLSTVIVLSAMGCSASTEAWLAREITIRRPIQASTGRQPSGTHARAATSIPGQTAG